MIEYDQQALDAKPFCFIDEKGLWIAERKLIEEFRKSIEEALDAQVATWKRQGQALRVVSDLEEIGNTADAYLFMDAHCTEFPEDMGIFKESNPTSGEH